MFSFAQVFAYLKKEFDKRDLLIAAVIVGLYFMTRLWNLDSFPIFSDEGIYIRWAKVAWHDASWRFISLTDGKQPLQTWGTVPFLKLFPENALLAGRLFSVSTGFVALIGFFSLMFYLFGKRAGFIGAFLYIFTPYFLFYDRLALVDSGVNAACIWIFFFSILLIRKRRLDIALIFGFIAGFSLLAKSSVRLFIGLSTLAPILLFEQRIKAFFFKTINYYFLFGISAIIGLLFYNVQRLSPFLHYVDQKNTTFVLTFAEFMQNPFALFWGNLVTVPQYVFWELGWIVGIFAFFGLLQLYGKDRRLTIYLLLWILIPYISIAFFARVLFPRYLIFLGSFILIFATYYFSRIKEKRFFLGLLGFLFITQLMFVYPILFSPKDLNFPPTDRGQYIEGKTAVWGVNDLMSFLRGESQKKPVFIVAEGNFGLVADVLDVFLRPTDKISIQGVWPLEEKDILKYQKETADKLVYIVFSHREVVPADWPVVLVKKYPKPKSKEALYLYKYTNQ